MNLPKGWSGATIGDLAQHVTSGSRGWAKFYADEGPAFIRIQNIRRGNINLDLTEVQHVRPPPGSEGERTKLNNQDILVTITADLGRIGLFSDGIQAYINQHVALVRLIDASIAEYVATYLVSPDAQVQLGLRDRGITRSGLGLDDIKNISVPIAPRAEQRRIIARLGTLTARLARARAELARISLLVDHLRKAALSRAFSGELTAAWRKEGKTKKGSKPSSWKVRNLGSISEIQGGIQVGKKRPAGAKLIETPYLRVANVQRGWLDLAEVKTLGVTKEEMTRLALKDGDILMNEGGDRDKLGRGWVWHDQIAGCIHQNHVFRIRLQDPAFPPAFVSHYANEFGQQYFIDQGTQTTNLASISKTKVSALPVPIPPAEEAKEIVRVIDAAFARADRLKTEAERAMRLLDRLEAALLAKAFKGELVPQDPSDEPADALLVRIKRTPTTRPPKRVNATKKRPASAHVKKDSLRMKNRQDRDVKGQRYLATILEGLEGRATAEELFAASDLSEVDFYKQLSDEYDKRWLTISGSTVEINQ